MAYMINDLHEWGMHNVRLGQITLEATKILK